MSRSILFVAMAVGLLAGGIAFGSNLPVGNAGFETVVPIDYFPLNSYGVWAGNPATIVTAENGVSPLEGSHMLKFTGGDPSANVWQLVDVSSLPAGTKVTFSAAFNQASSSSANFQMRIAALNHGPPSNGNPELDLTTIAVLHPSIPTNTWTTASLDAILPAGTISIGIEVAASAGSLAYADSVQVTPEPSSIVLAVLGIAGLSGFRLRRHTHMEQVP